MEGYLDAASEAMDECGLGFSPGTEPVEIRTATGFSAAK